MGTGSIEVLVDDSTDTSLLFLARAVPSDPVVINSSESVLMFGSGNVVVVSFEIWFAGSI